MSDVPENQVVGLVRGEDICCPQCSCLIGRWCYAGDKTKCYWLDIVVKNTIAHGCRCGGFVLVRDSAQDGLFDVRPIRVPNPCGLDNKTYRKILRSEMRRVFATQSAPSSDPDGRRDFAFG